MTTNLRLSLTILSIGFAVEGGSELYSVATRGAFKPGPTFIFFVPIAATLLGLLFVWVGRHEWNELHRRQVRRAHVLFGISLLGGVVAGGVVALLAYQPRLGSPLWAEALFGGAIASLVLGTFVTYVLLVFHLVRRPSKAVLVASIAWALVVSGFVGETMAVNLPAILSLVARRSFSVPGFLAPVDTLSSYLFLSYFLLLAAYVEAHRQVVRGRLVDPTLVDSAPKPG